MFAPSTCEVDTGGGYQTKNTGKVGKVHGKGPAK